MAVQRRTPLILQSFNYAFEGVIWTLRTQRNMRLHFAVAAVVQVQGPQGTRSIPFAEFHRLPGEKAHIDTTLRHDEIITSIDLPPRGFADHYAYLKLRDRASYAFALVSVAAALEMDGDTISEARRATSAISASDEKSTTEPRSAPVRLSICA